jgi:aldose 1-epimerase
MTDKRLATVRLSDSDAQIEATFVPGAGMLCCSLRHRGEELLAQNAGVAAYAERGKTMGIPLLYPWANRLAAFDYTVAGRTVSVPHDDPALIALDQNGLPIHGVIGGRLAWELTDAPGDHAQSLAARLSWSEAVPELFEVFPFRHELLYEARLADGRLEIEVTVHACGADAVPLAFGFHPYLAPGGPREQWLIELPAMRHLALDREQIPLGVEDPASAPRRFELGGREFDDGFDAEATPTPVRFAVTAPARRLELELLRG